MSFCYCILLNLDYDKINFKLLDYIYIYISRQFICFHSPFGWIFMAEKISIVVVTTELLLGHV